MIFFFSKLQRRFFLKYPNILRALFARHLKMPKSADLQNALQKILKSFTHSLSIFRVYIYHQQQSLCCTSSYNKKICVLITRLLPVRKTFNYISRYAPRAIDIRVKRIGTIFTLTRLRRKSNLYQHIITYTES